MRYEVEEKIEVLRTERLRRLADKYATPFPRFSPRDGNWEHGRTGRWYLTRPCYASIWLQIQEAQKRRREAWLSWLPLVTAITGLLGAATGLVALLTK